MSGAVINTNEYWDAGKIAESIESKLDVAAKHLFTAMTTMKNSGMSNIILKNYTSAVMSAFHTVSTLKARCGTLASYYFSTAEIYEKTETILQKIINNKDDPLKDYSNINYSEIRRITDSELSGLGISISTDSPRIVYIIGDKLITVESNVNVKANNDASIEYEINPQDIIEKQLTSLKNITFNSDAATISVSEDGLEIGMLHPIIKDNNGNVLDSALSVVIAPGTISPIAQGIKITTSTGDIDIETTIVVEDLSNQWGYEPVRVPQEYPISEYSKNERYRFALEDWKNAVGEGVGKAIDIIPEVLTICGTIIVIGNPVTAPVVGMMQLLPSLQ